MDLPPLAAQQSQTFNGCEVEAPASFINSPTRCELRSWITASISSETILSIDDALVKEIQAADLETYGMDASSSFTVTIFSFPGRSLIKRSGCIKKESFHFTGSI